MLTIIVIIASVAVLITIPVVRKVRRFCLTSPGSRTALITGATAVLIGAAVAAPQVNNVAPHMHDSPAGVFPILGAAAAVGIAALLAIAIIVGVVLSLRPPRPDPASRQ